MFTVEYFCKDEGPFRWEVVSYHKTLSGATKQFNSEVAKFPDSRFRIMQTRCLRDYSPKKR